MIPKNNKPQEDLKLRLARIVKRSSNKTCADCPEKRPNWVSLIKPQQAFALGSNILASFVCLQCAGLHRKLGTHICFVRSVNLDEWDKEYVDAAEYTGNEVVNEIFEGHLKRALSNNSPSVDTGNIKPLEGALIATRERFIRQKYVDLYFYSKNSHYKHISYVMTKKKEKLSLKAPQSPGKAVRKQLSIFLKNGISEKQLKTTKSASGCSTTIGNTTTSTAKSYEKSCHPLPANFSIKTDKFNSTRGDSDDPATLHNPSHQEELDFTTQDDDDDRIFDHKINSAKKETFSSNPLPKESPHSITMKMYSQRRHSSRGRSRSKLRESSGTEANNKHVQERNRSTSRVRNTNCQSHGRRGRSKTALRKDQDIIADVGIKSQDRSSSRVRSSSKKSSGKNLDIREKGKNSASLRRSRSCNPDPLGRSKLLKGGGRNGGICRATLVPDEENQPLSSNNRGTENHVPTSKDDELSGMILVLDDDDDDDDDTTVLESDSDVPRRNRQRRSGSRRPRKKSRGRMNESNRSMESLNNRSMESLNNSDLEGYNNNSRVRGRSESRNKVRYSSSDLLVTAKRDVSRSTNRGQLATPVGDSRGSRGRSQGRRISRDLNKNKNVTISPVRRRTISKSPRRAAPNNESSHKDKRNNSSMGSSARTLDTKLPLEEDAPHSMPSTGFEQNDDNSSPFQASHIIGDRNRSRSRSTRNLNTNSSLVDSHSSPRNVCPLKIKPNNTESDKVTIEPLNDRRSSRHDDLKQNLNNSGEDDFQIIEHSSFGHCSDSSWTDGSFSKPYVNKKGVDATIKNRRRCGREMIDINNSQRQCRKNDIFASLNRAELESNKPITQKEKGSVIRINPQRTKSNDIIVGSKKLTSTIRRSTPGRSKSGNYGSKSNVKPEYKLTTSLGSGQRNKALMEEWKKMKNENEALFSGFENNFSRFHSKT